MPVQHPLLTLPYTAPSYGPVPRYPNACPALLLLRFFQTYAVWPWPLPVMLIDTYDEPHLGLAAGAGKGEVGGGNSRNAAAGGQLRQQQLELQRHPVWNPQAFFKDQAQQMPIITPAFPAMNST
jgi:hypothetical protein